MEGITQDDVLEILRMVEESEFDELHLEIGELKLIVNKSRGKNVTAFKSDSMLEKALQSEAVEKPQALVTEQKAEAMASPGPDDTGLVAIKAPMLGTFYSSPKPGSPPFVKVGQDIKEDDTVCIIEVMKLFSTVKAGVRGRISKILAENSQMVEYNQPLFLVEQETAEGKEREAVS
jgi:acetyl-CoA carboxylase biotin carboxyl carrier protein